LPPRFDARSYTVHGNIEVEDPFIPFAMGRTLRRWQEGNFHGLEFELAEPVQFAVVLAGDYHSYTETRDGQTITLSSYAFSQDEPMRVIANNLFELIDYYEEMLGDFPYPELNILEINAFGFGIAPPGVIYLTREGFDPGPTGRSFRKEVNRRMAHEVGHMWWGHVAQMASPDDQWLSESICEYLAAVALEDLVGRNSMNKALREWRAETANSKGVTSIYMANRLSGERAGYDRRNLLYSRGPLMFQALREEIGDEAFFTIVRRLANDTRFEHITTLDFLELTNEVTGESYIEWFERELFGLE
jgi:aminopeptidase N